MSVQKSTSGKILKLFWLDDGSQREVTVRLLDIAALTREGGEYAVHLKFVMAAAKVDEVTYRELEAMLMKR